MTGLGDTERLLKWSNFRFSDTFIIFRSKEPNEKYFRPDMVTAFHDMKKLIQRGGPYQIEKLAVSINASIN